MPVHPRGYGEHFHKELYSLYDDGSSPWVRGTYFSLAALGSPSRFIPVGTGNIGESHEAFEQRTVHPRGYGEHLWGASYMVENYGSSPWVRGTYMRLKSLR